MSLNIDHGMERFEFMLNKRNLDHKPYQYDGVKWCLENELHEDPTCGVRGGFIADEMGLGKTIMMIGVMFCNNLTRTLIIVPPILIDQWVAQFRRVTGHKKVLVYHGENKKDITLEQLNTAKFVITSYGGITLTRDQLKQKKVTMIHRVKWDRIVFDEAHHLRNKDTTLYTCTRMLQANIRWLVSGTPIQNSKDDFYNLCRILRLPSSFYADSKNLRQLAKSFLLRRTKKQVGIHISNLHLDTNQVEWTNEKEKNLSEELHSVLNFSKVEKEKHSDGQIVKCYQKITALVRARQTCILPRLMTKSLDYLVDKGILKDYNSYREAFDSTSKLDAVCASILQRKDNECGKIIFCHYREEIDEVATRLMSGGMKVAMIDGRINASKRYEILKGSHDALILQFQTGCEGLNLQENYSEIYFIAPHWNPAIEDQAIARCYRIGQTKPVFVKRFEMCSFNPETDIDVQPINIDRHIHDTQNVKRIMANEILNK